jgi:DegV family protein with EDD domain
VIKIVTDSTCDMPDEWVSRYDVRVVPINIQFGSETYREGVTIDHAGFYRKVDELGIIPATSQPSAGEFCEVYQALAGEAGDVISIHVTAKLSGTTQSAELAADMVKGQVRVHVIDSMAGSAGLGWMILDVARMIEAAASLEEIIAHLEATRRQLTVVLMLADLRYAQMSGRVGRLQSALASLLDVKPIIWLEDGQLDVRERVRSRSRAIEQMLAISRTAVGANTPVNVATVHAEAPTEAEKLLELAQENLNVRETFIEDLATSLAVHFGPGTIGLVTYPAGS